MSEQQDFSEETIQQRWKYANGHCEKCGTLLIKSNRGLEYGKSGWTAHHYISRRKGGTGSFDNCRILCNPCHIETDSFGTHD